MNKSFARLRRDEGDTLVSVMGAMVVGGLVLAMAAMFWVNSGKGANSNADVSQQQASALRVVNSIVGDVNNADAVLFGNSTTLVTERQVTDKATGVVSNVRTKYTRDGDGNIVQTRRTNAPSGPYNEADTFGPGTGATSKTLATKASDEDMFGYFATDKKSLDSPLSLPNPDTGSKGDVEQVKRVDINFKADAGNGNVELQTKASVNKKRSSAEGDDLGLPGLICPAAPDLSTSNGTVKVRWGAATDVEEYYVVRNGTKIGPIAESFLTGGTYEWTDNSPDVGSVNTYSIEVRSGVEVNDACAAATISVPLPTPNASGVVDGSNDFKISWDAVPGATSYDVYYREVNNSTYTQPKAWKVKSTTSTTLTLAEGGNQAREFYVVANAGNISSEESPRFVLLSAPDVPNLKVEATDYNKNRLTVEGEDGSVEIFAAYRQASAGPLTNFAFKVGYGDEAGTSVIDGLDTTFGDNSDFSEFKAGDDQKYLGYDYNYYVYTSNTGPRTSAQWFATDRAEWNTGNAGVLALSSTVSDTKTAKQFPADPVASATGSEANPVGTNQVTWNAARGADTYEIFRTFGNEYGSYESNDGDRFWSTGTNRSFTDAGGAKRGTRHYYMAIGVNSTGLSPNRIFGNDDRAAAFQKPEAPVVLYNFGKKPSLDTKIKAETKKPEGNYFQADWIFNNGEFQPDYPQQNQPAKHQFCDGTTDVCKYVSKINGVTQKTSSHTDKAMDGTATNWGVNDDLTVDACNPGGCATGSMDVKTYPGPFEMTDFDLLKQSMYVWQGDDIDIRDRVWRWGHVNSSLSNADTSFAGTKSDWSKSQGAGSYTAMRGDWNGLWWDWANRKTVNANTRTSDFWTASPSSTYRMSVYAQSAFDPNLKRMVSAPNNQEDWAFDGGINFTTLQTAPLPPSRIDNRKRCYRYPSGANKNKFNYDYWGSRMAYSDSTWNATADGFQSYTDIDKINHYAVTGTVPTTYMGTKWDTSGAGSRAKILDHSAANLAALEAGGSASASNKYKWAHNYKDTQYGPRSDGSKDAFGFHVENVDMTTGRATGNYVIHQLDSRLALSANAGDGKGPRYLDIDYRPNVGWLADFDVECGYGTSWYDVATGGSIQRIGVPTKVLPDSIIPMAEISQNRYYYYHNQGGDVVSFPKNEQPRPQ